MTEPNQRKSEPSSNHKDSDSDLFNFQSFESLDADRIVPRDATDNIPLSFSQQRLWFINQFETDSNIYHIKAAYRLKGNLNISAINHAFSEIKNRHESLRTTFTIKNNVPIQIITPPTDISIPIIDLSDTPQKDREERVLEILEQLMDMSLDLTKKVFRTNLIKVGKNDHIYFLNIHHIATDGWSQSIFYKELKKLYQAFIHGEPSPLPELPLQYADFAIWQRDWLQGSNLEKQLSYWNNKLEDLPFLEIPIDHSRPPNQTYVGETHRFFIPIELTSKLKELSNRERTTIFMVMLGVYKILLMRYSGNADICVGTPIAGRNRIEIEKLIGCFVNTLVLRTNLSGNPAFIELLNRIRDTTLDAYDYQDMPFEQLVAELNPERDLSRPPIIQTLLTFQNIPNEPLDIEGLNVEKLTLGKDKARFDLTLTLWDTQDGLSGMFKYNCDLFESRTIERLSNSFLVLVKSIISNPNQKIGDIPLFPETLRNQILFEWNNTQTDYSRDVCIHELFEAQAKLKPDAHAIIFQNKSITYKSLNEHANQLAHALRNLGIGPEKNVGILFERSIESIVSLMAVLKAGGAYVPIDPKYPTERLSYIIRDSKISVILTQDHVKSVLPPNNCEILCVESKQKILSKEKTNNPKNLVQGDNLAYIMYTSGSTGRPKGAAITHRSLLNNLLWTNNILFQGKDLLIPNLTNITFDACLKQIFSPLIRGGTVWLVSEEDITNPPEFLHSLPTGKQFGINCVPSFWAAILEVVERDSTKMKFEHFTHLFLGAEKIDQHLINKTYELFPDIEIWNLYGPTETTANVTAAPLNQESKISIGKPLSNTQSYVLDTNLHPVPIGTPGILYIGGDGLARGYFEKPKLTAEKFIPNPFTGKMGSKIFNTGDQVRWLPDGRLDFLGRADNQVKVRGYRIEMGEIETAICRMDNIKKVVVLVSGDRLEEKKLAAFIVPKTGTTLLVKEIREHVKSILPGYMIPSTYVFLDEIPLTHTGKINSSKLLSLNQSTHEIEKNCIPPQSTVEAALVGIWEDVLNLEKVGVADNFFDIGGHSLLATMLTSRIQNIFSIEVPLRSLFQDPTIEGLATFIINQEDEPGKTNKIAEMLVEIQKMSAEEVDLALEALNLKD